MQKNNKDNVNKALLLKIKRLEKENKKLKSDYKTLSEVYEQTEDYLIAVLQNRSVDEIVEGVKKYTFLNKSDECCPNCSNKHLNKQDKDGYYILSCMKCGYRNRFNE